MSDVCQVTNNTGNSVAILTPVQSTAPNLSQMGTVFNNMEVCKLSSGKSSIANGANDNVILDETYLDTNNQPQPAIFYDLLACETTWYQPVANVSVDNILGNGFGSVTLPQNTIMQDAATFLQYISAYPSSKLTQDYTTAMQTAQTNGNAAINSSSSSSSTTSSADPTAAVTSFFANTQNFKDVTIDAVTAMQAYYNNFPCVWAEYKNNVTYYLYASGSGGANTSFMGTITLTLSGGNLNLTKPNAGFTCTFTPASNPSDMTSVNVNASQALNLVYSNGQFNEVNAGDVPKVAVSGLFQLKSKFTQNPNDSSIITVLTGTINGQTVFGCDTNQETQGPSQQLFDFSTPSAAFGSVLEIAGGLQFLMFMGETIKGIVTWFKNRGKLSTEQLLAKQSTELDQKIQKLMDDQNAQIKELTKAQQAKFDDGVKKLSNGKIDPDNPPKGAELAQVDDTLNAAGQRKSLKLINDASAEQIEAVAKNASGMDASQIQSLEQNAQQVKTTNESLNKAVPDDQLVATVAQEKPQVLNVSDNVKNFTTEVSQQLNASAKTNIEESVKTSTELTENMQEVEERTTNVDEPEKTPTVEPEEVLAEVH